MIILPCFPKRGCWILSNSHLLSIRICRIKVLKSRNCSQKNKTKCETSDARCQLLWKNLVFGLEEEISPRQVNSVNITWWRVDFLVTR